MLKTIYIFNPAYKLKNDRKRIFITDNGEEKKEIKNINTDFLSLVNPIHAIMFTFFDGLKTLEICQKLISDFFNIPIENIPEILDIYIENSKEIITEYEGIRYEIPKNVIIKNNNKDTRTLKPEDFIIEPEDFDFKTERLYTPLGLTFMITNKCVTDCIYCYADRKTKYNELSFERVKEIIKEARNIGMRNFDLNGGELFLYKYWEKLLTELYKYGFNPYISTKVPIDTITINKLIELGVKTIQISIDSIDKTILSTMLNVSHTYKEKIQDTIINCDKSGIKIRINTVLTKYNIKIDKVKELLEFLISIKNVENINLTVAGYSIYKSELDYLKYRPTEKSIFKLQNFLKEFKKNNITIPNIELNGYAQKNEFEGSLKYKKENFNNRAKCTGNIENFYILPDGKVTICEELYWHPRFLIGNLQKNSIDEVWNSSKAWDLFNLSKEMVQEKSACKTCNDFDKCYKVPGHCWKLVIEAYGEENWDFPDPRCQYAPKPFNKIYVE